MVREPGDSMRGGAARLCPFVTVSIIVLPHALTSTSVLLTLGSITGIFAAAMLASFASAGRIWLNFQPS